MKVKVVRNDIPDLIIRINKMNLSSKVANEFSRTLKRKIKERVSAGSTGELAKSVKVIGRQKDKSASKGHTNTVVANDYFWYVNYGRPPGRMPPDIAKIRAWVGKMWRIEGESSKDAVYDFRKHVATFGTKKKLFYESSKKLVRSKFPNIVKRSFKKN